MSWSQFLNHVWHISSVQAIETFFPWQIFSKLSLYLTLFLMIFLIFLEYVKDDFNNPRKMTKWEKILISQACSMNRPLFKICSNFIFFFFFNLNSKFSLNIFATFFFIQIMIIDLLHTFPVWKSPSNNLNPSKLPTIFPTFVTFSTNGSQALSNISSPFQTFNIPFEYHIQSSIPFLIITSHSYSRWLQRFAFSEWTPNYDYE